MKRFFLAVLCVAAFIARAEDWPCFLGPRHDNTSIERGLIDRFPTNGPRVLWEKEVGTGYSAPSAMAGQLVLFHRLGGEEVIQSFDAASGQTGWRFAYPSSFTDPYGYNNGPRCTPLLTSNRCYTFGAEGKLTCVDRVSGKLIWQHDTAKEWNVPEAFFGVGSTPLLEGNKLIVMVGGQPNSGVVAFESETGKTLWENVGKTNWNGAPMIGWLGERLYRWSGVEKSASYSSPVAATIHGQRHVLCVMRQGLVSLNPTNGAVHFSRWFQSVGSDSVNGISPVIGGDMVFMSAAYFRVGSFLLRVNPDGNTFEEIWRQPKAYGERDGSGAMLEPVLGIHWNTPILRDGFVFAFDGRNEPDAFFKCVELKTGKLMWSRDERWRGHPAPGVKAQPPAFGRGSAILADNKLIALGEGGLLGLFKPNTNACEEISRWQVPSLHFPCWAAPVLSNKKLYLRSEDRLVCVDLAK